MERNPNCKQSCKTQNHISEAECWRENMPMFVGCQPSKGPAYDRTFVKKDEKELNSYYDAIKQGIEPRSTRQRDIDAAVRMSDSNGSAFDGTTLTFKK